MARRNVTRGAPPRLARSRRRGGAAGGGAPKEGTSRRSRSGDDPESTLGLYFREMSEMALMTADQEAEAACRIARRRAEYWRSLLSYPPYTAAVIELCVEALDADDEVMAKIRAAAARLRRAARRVRDRDTRAHREVFMEAASRLALEVGYVDTDGLVSDRVAADLDTLDAGYRAGISLEVRPPRAGSRPFQVYVTRVRQAQAALRAEKHAFVKKNLRLVVSIARRFNHGKLPLQDLIQEGNIGLMKAVDRFDHRKGFRFSTYGSWWIRHAISRAIADKGREIRLPVHMLDAHQKLARARREIEARTGKEPTTQELADHTGLPLAKVEKMDLTMLDPPISLDRRVSGDDERCVMDFLQDEDAQLPGDQIEVDSINSQVQQVITGLRPIEADILRKRFGLIEDRELTLKEIGRHYSLSRERIRQLQEQALAKLRRELERREAV